MQVCSVLYLGDIVGRTGRHFIKEQLLRCVDRYKPDFIFANAENATHGFGLNASTAQELYEAGIQGITLGNHTWDQRGFWNEIDQLDYVCRPANFPQTCPGKTYLIFEFRGEKMAIFCLLGRGFMQATLDCPFQASRQLIQNLNENGVHNFIVDVHAETTSEKYALGWFLSDLGVSCVVGTHTHVQTADERILNNQTAFICDLGMCGAYNGILGCRPAPIIEKLVCGKPCRFEVAPPPATINGVFVSFDLETHRALSIERIHIVESEKVNKVKK